MGRKVNANAPGLKCKRNGDGTFRWYWGANRAAIKRGYRPAVVRLHYDDTPDGKAQQAARCRTLQQEMLAWLANGGEFPRHGFDGTMGSLCRIYETHDCSPMRKMKYNGQINRAKDLKIICNTVGARQIGRLIGPDFVRWHEQWGAPAAPGRPPRLTRAKHCIDAVRAAVAFGVVLDLPGCAKVDVILGKMRFAKPPPRDVQMTLAQVQAIVPTAHTMGRGSIALATTLQFETGLRQKDVIGEWWPNADGAGGGGIAWKGTRWGTGLLWSDINPDWILRKKTSKRGVPVEHDLKLCPLAMAELQRVPVERRVGPLIISEATGEPYKNKTFTHTFRRVANRAGVPKEVWNMDSRAGAVSESYAAGASQTDVMKLAGHQDARTNSKYNRSSLEQTRRVAELRQQKRDVNND